MSKILADGFVSECLPNLTFRVTLTDDTEIMAYTSGKMKLHKIKVIVGDKVTVELDPYGGKVTNRIIKRK